MKMKKNRDKNYTVYLLLFTYMYLVQNDAEE